MSEYIELWQQAFVKGFKLSPYDKTLYSNVIGQYEGKQVEIMVREKRKKPSGALHGYYRGVIIPTALNDEQFRGWSATDLHDHLKGLFLKDVRERKMGSATILIVDIESTGDISSKKMSKFIDEVRQYLAEKGIETNDPTTQN